MPWIGRLNLGFKSLWTKAGDVLAAYVLLVVSLACRVGWVFSGQTFRRSRAITSELVFGGWFD